MKSKSWPRRPQKWPLDLNDLGSDSVNFFKNYIFKISASSWEKWAIARISSQTFKIQNFVYFMAASEDRELKTGICKSLNRKPSNSSFFSAWCTNFKNVLLKKKYWSPSEVVEVKRLSRVIFEVAEAKFWISSNFYRFSLENFHRFKFRGCLTSATSATSKTPG